MAKLLLSAAQLFQSELVDGFIVFCFKQLFSRNGCCYSTKTTLFCKTKHRYDSSSRILTVSDFLSSTTTAATNNTNSSNDSNHSNYSNNSNDSNNSKSSLLAGGGEDVFVHSSKPVTIAILIVVCCQLFVVARPMFDICCLLFEVVVLVVVVLVLVLVLVLFLLLLSSPSLWL